MSLNCWDVAPCQEHNSSSLPQAIGVVSTVDHWITSLIHCCGPAWWTGCLIGTANSTQGTAMGHHNHLRCSHSCFFVSTPRVTTPVTRVTLDPQGLRLRQACYTWVLHVCRTWVWVHIGQQELKGGDKIVGLFFHLTPMRFLCLLLDSVFCKPLVMSSLPSTSNTGLLPFPSQKLLLNWQTRTLQDTTRAHFHMYDTISARPALCNIPFK